MAAKRKDERVIIHFDYDCFYASVFEAENPTLKCLPLAVQQKQIIVTCNYEARRRGLRKLQLITEAKKTCPEVVIVLGEDLTRFRDASKILYKFLERFSWNKKVERLGFDEVFMDVTDIVDYNQDLLNPNDLTNSFFQLVKGDPTQGFPYDATQVSGHSYPDFQSAALPTCGAEERQLYLRLILGSHLACHLRLRLEEENGYTSTVGISTTKLIAKLVGNLHKPKGQTTLLPPYTIRPQIEQDGERESNITTFVDAHDVGKIPGIGFKTSHLIRNHILSRTAEFENGLIYGETKENITVRDVRLFPNMGPELLEKLLGGKPGAEKGIGGKIWNLLNGVDNTEVKTAKNVPSQISIEDSYMRLDNFPQVIKEIRSLATSLVRRMHMDLLEDDNDNGILKQQTSIDQATPSNLPTRKWLAHPRTLRLSTNPRRPSGERSFNRISRSAPLPSFVFNLHSPTDTIVEKLINETLLPMFRKLHPEKGGWNLSLVNICVANMAELKGNGRDIGSMFKKQEEVLGVWKVEDRDVPPDGFDNQDGNHVENDHDWDAMETEFPATIQSPSTTAGIEDTKAEPSAGNDVFDPRNPPSHQGIGSEDLIYSDDDDDTDEDQELGWEDAGGGSCSVCGAYLPAFAMPAHERFHEFAGGDGG